ncbi:MAG: hypothetical protein GWN87_12105, partial [Desulfuromonadales bacterium]|nr:hypothetical protein [Desulfuromonadales bacterium]NIS41172.1 hypothetical protein [Desulfuromonadales bacterium]
LDAVLTFFTTGYYEEEDDLGHMEPNAYGKWVFVLSNVERLDSRRDRQLLTAMAERKRASLDAPIDDLVDRLGPQGRRVYRFITNRDPAKIETLKEGLPPSILADIERLDLANKDLTKLQCRLIIAHGYDDDIIPYTQGVDLAQAVPRDRVDLYLVDGLAHVDLEPGLISRYRLWQAKPSATCSKNATASPATEHRLALRGGSASGEVGAFHPSRCKAGAINPPPWRFYDIAKSPNASKRGSSPLEPLPPRVHSEIRIGIMLA